MPGIPPVLDADAEDVAWALQTAEALWKRGEKGDAVVWLRRAAQAAGELEDDDRALMLARAAAELTEGGSTPAPAPSHAPAAPSAPPVPPATGAAVDDLLRSSQVEADEIDIRVSVVPQEVEVAPPLPPPVPPPVRPLAPTVPLADTPQRPAPPPAPAPPHAAPPLPPRTPVPAPPPPLAAELEPDPVDDGDRVSRVPSAAEKHAGILDPWADGARDDAPPPRRPPLSRAPSPPPVPVAAASAPSPRTPSPPPPTPAPPSAALHALVGPPPSHPLPAPPVVPPTPPAFDSDEVVTSAPPSVKAGPVKPPPPLPPPRKPPPPSAPPRSVPKPAPPPTAGVDLSNVEAFADLPDDARAAFAGAASLHTLAREEEIATFALAFVLEGTVDLAATVIDAPAARLVAGQVLRAHGTIEHVTPLRLVGSADVARVATWDEDAVRDAFHACPWVEDDLRAAGDRYQAEVGITLGPLGERLDLGLRAELTRRLTMRVLAEGEACTTRGKPVPGLLVVGAGELELVGEDDTPTGEPLRAGDLVFASEVLTAAPAPHTARAAKGGALVFQAERGSTQELLMTFPPLMDIVAGG